MPIAETLSRTKTKVRSLDIVCGNTFSAQNGGRRLATALERWTCITDLRLVDAGMESLQILLLESIPKMLVLKKLYLAIRNCDHRDRLFDMVARCIERPHGVIVELILDMVRTPDNTSMVGLAPALRRLKVFQFYGPILTSEQIGQLSGIAEACDTLEEFRCDLPGNMLTHDFKARLFVNFVQNFQV